MLNAVVERSDRTSCGFQRTVFKMWKGRRVEFGRARKRNVEKLFFFSVFLGPRKNDDTAERLFCAVQYTPSSVKKRTRIVWSWKVRPDGRDEKSGGRVKKCRGKKRRAPSSHAAGTRTDPYFTPKNCKLLLRPRVSREKIIYIRTCIMVTFFFSFPRREAGENVRVTCTGEIFSRNSIARDRDSGKRRGAPTHRFRRFCKRFPRSNGRETIAHTRFLPG